MTEEEGGKGKQQDDYAEVVGKSLEEILTVIHNSASPQDAPGLRNYLSAGIISTSLK